MAFQLISVRSTTLTCYKYLGKSQFHCSATQLISKKNPETKNNKVVVSKDGSFIACWHPEAEYPYEHTRPMPRDEKAARMADSVLKVQLPDEYLKSDKNYGPNIYELAKIFSATVPSFKHKPRQTRQALYHRRRPPVPDREGI